MGCVTEVIEVVKIVKQAVNVLNDILKDIPVGAPYKPSSTLKSDPQDIANQIVSKSQVASGNIFFDTFKYTYNGDETAPPNYRDDSVILPGVATTLFTSIVDKAGIASYIQQTFKVSDVIKNSDMNDFGGLVSNWIENSLKTPNKWVSNTFSKQFLGLSGVEIEYDVQLLAIWVNDVDNNTQFYLLTYTSVIYGCRSFGSTSCAIVKSPSGLYNVIGSSDDPKIDKKDWIELLRDEGINTRYCIVQATAENPHSKSPYIRYGGHMTTNSDGSVTGSTCYLIPICPRHNKIDGVKFEVDDNTQILQLFGYNESYSLAGFLLRLRTTFSMRDRFRG